MNEKTTQAERARAAGCPVVDFDIEGDPDFRTNLRAKWDEARELGPIFYSTAAEGFWVLAGQEEIRAALGDPETFSARQMMVFSRRPMIDLHLIPMTLDPPEHTVYRHLLTPLLGPRAVEQREPEMRAVANELIDAILASGDECDFMHDFAYKLPGRVFGTWLGLPKEAAEDYAALATAQVHYDPTSDPDGSALASLRDQMIGHLVALIAARRKQPRDDIVSELIAKEVDGRPLTDEELVNIGSLLFLAGFDTTAGAIGEVVGHLAIHTGDRDRVVERPDLLPRLVEECLRFYAISGSSGRLVMKDAEIGGCSLRQGDRIFSALQAANRDSRVIDNPDVMDMDRWPNRHVSFGLGVHRCLGSHVARAEIVCSVGEWLRRIPRFSLKEGTTLRHNVSITTAFTELPLVLEQVPA